MQFCYPYQIVHNLHGYTKSSTPVPSMQIIFFRTLFLSPLEEHVFFLSERVVAAHKLWVRPPNFMQPLYKKKESFQCISTVFQNKTPYFNVIWGLHMPFLNSFFSSDSLGPSLNPSLTTKEQFIEGF
jgi:hypothetical protein